MAHQNEQDWLQTLATPRSWRTLVPVMKRANSVSASARMESVVGTGWPTVKQNMEEVFAVLCQHRSPRRNRSGYHCYSSPVKMSPAASVTRQTGIKKPKNTETPLGWLSWRPVPKEKWNGQVFSHWRKPYWLYRHATAWKITCIGYRHANGHETNPVFTWEMYAQKCPDRLHW